MNAPSDPLEFLNGGPENLRQGTGNDLVQSLLYEIVRVKDLIKYYEELPGGAGQLGAAILKELVAEAYNSLVNYDTELMSKYYDLLQNCD
ncbi:hypothetical protein [Mucilaginibacter ginkgonis]|uniref:Uncharacterized protein n=1 Tax=Mucilaginibacter ginkgonis TaxID=2682091 RepID=A0A6I4HWV7_9SPHI|nr:hypothetical protein [Mucilaginibacter ginkgonis]QQL51186.1 hypothetical protein GO620_006985 [Mucilaginibacter ginkgonis]